MKKSIILLFALLPMLAMAQITPEAIIGLCPQLPSVTELASINQDAVDVFNTKIREAIKQAEEAGAKNREADKSKYLNDLNANFKKKYGKSADEFSAMSESQRQSFGENYANKQLKSMGINRSATEIEKMNEAETQQMASQMLTNLTGLSAADIQKLQKMEGMSEEETLAYMQQTGMLGKMQDMGTKMAKTNNSQATSASSAQMEELMKKQNTYNNEVTTFVQASRKKREALLDKARQIYISKYSAHIDALEERLGELSNEYTGHITRERSNALETQMKSLRDEIDRQNVAYRTEIATPWLEQILKEMAQIKSLIQSAKIADAANEQMLKLMGEAVYPQQEAVMWAMEYLSTAMSVLDYEPSKESMITID